MTEQELNSKKVSADIYPTKFGVYRVEHGKNGSCILFKPNESDKEYHLSSAGDGLNYPPGMVTHRILKHYRAMDFIRETRTDE